MKYNKEDIPKEKDTDNFVAHEVVMGDLNVGYEIFKKEVDTGPLFKGLQNDSCQAPHWGYAFKGDLKSASLTIRKKRTKRGYLLHAAGARASYLCGHRSYRVQP